MQKRQMRVGTMALAALAVVLGQGRTATAAPTLPGTTQVQASDVLPYTTEGSGAGGGPIVRVTLDDKTQATFLLDTGTSECAVTGAMAARLGLTPRPIAQAAAPLIMDGDRATAVPLTIQIGRFRFPRYPTLVIKESRFQQVLGRRLDGILGMGLLQHFAVILAPQSHVMTLVTPGKMTAAQVQSWGFRRASVLPLTRASNGTYWAMVGLTNGDYTARENLMVDTGAGTSVLSHAAARSLKLVPLQRGLDVPYGNGTFVGDLARVPAVTLGVIAGAASPARTTLTHNNGTFLYPSRPETAVGSPHVLGMNILSGCSVLLDFPGNTLYLQPMRTDD